MEGWRARTRPRSGENIGAVRCDRPQNGAEYLESLRDGREVYIYGERVDDVTTHPAFRNTARMTARLFDALHDKEKSKKLLLPTDTDGKGQDARVLQSAEDASRNRSQAATRSPSGNASPTAGWAARRTTKRRSWARSAATPSSTRRSRRTRSAGTRSARSACRS